MKSFSSDCSINTTWTPLKFQLYRSFILFFVKLTSELEKQKAMPSFILFFFNGPKDVVPLSMNRSSSSFEKKYFKEVYVQIRYYWASVKCYTWKIFNSMDVWTNLGYFGGGCLIKNGTSCFFSWLAPVWGG